MPLRGGKGLKEIVKSFDKVKLRAYAAKEPQSLKRYFTSSIRHICQLPVPLAFTIHSSRFFMFSKSAFKSSVRI